MDDHPLTVTCDGKANHYIYSQVWTVEGNYESELVKENERWLVTKLKFNFLHQSGNLELPQLATMRMKNN